MQPASETPTLVPETLLNTSKHFCQNTSSMATALLGIDTGGTFTDFVLLRAGELSVHKVLSRPDAPQEAILQGIEEMGLADDVRRGDVRIIHGTTVATNAVLEGKGVSTAYVTNRGFGDVLRIGRQTRPELYNLTPIAGKNPLDDALVFEVDCRLGPGGEEITPLTGDAIRALVDAINSAAPDAVAINLLFSFIDDRHERQIEEALAGDRFVCRSSAVMPEYREYERGVTTWVNAWIGPIIHRYLTNLVDRLSPAHVSIMQSSGLTVAATQAANRAVNLLLSGPAGGLSGAMSIGQQGGDTRLMTFDMGGTSSDVALLDGEIQLTSAGHIRDFPIGVPTADIHTIGAGGGSIAWLDDGGLLQVGPASAGASPGPACYGHGGEQPTVTDANLVLGRLRPDAFLGGSMTLDLDAARNAIASLADPLGLDNAEVAAGIVSIANEHMTQALRVISVQRGFDPRDFTLACFGGAGGLHVCDLAENLEMSRCLVPVNGGVLSAFGMLTASPGREIVHTRTGLVTDTTEEEITRRFAAMIEEGEAELAREGVAAEQAEKRVDVRYAGQTFTISLPYTSLEALAAAFSDEHERLYGHRLDKPVEIVNLRIHIEGAREAVELPGVESDQGATEKRVSLAGIDGDVPVRSRTSFGAEASFEGPMLITERHSTTLVKPGWKGTVDRTGNLVLERDPGS